MTTTATKRIDRDKVIAVIRAEQRLIYGVYVEGGKPPAECASPGHCALGALLFAAGMPNKDIASLDEPGEWDEGSLAEQMLADVYGLHRVHADAIMCSNDAASGDSFAERQARVIATVEQLAFRQTNDAAADERECEKMDARRRDRYDIDATIDYDD